ncbi:unnamed protein product [Chrysoparadoxa australica]
MTTGALPTFIDFRNNFHGPEIEEDNWVQQLVDAGKRLTFMGDDTWTSLFPRQFQRSFPYPSFNTRDLHTVDDGVMAHLAPELERDDWDLLVAHFLGVDHVGHTFGPSSKAMEDKLTQMDGALREVFAFADRSDDVLVLVMGDHGMTSDGNHGGATEEEQRAALLVYGSALAKASQPGGGVLVWDQGFGRVAEVEHAVLWSKLLGQVDLVPSISLLMGAPIPYGSLGGLIPELFLDEPEPHTYDTLSDALLINSAQVWRYLESYAKVAALPPRELWELHNLLTDAKRQHRNHRQGMKIKGESLHHACLGYMAFLDGAVSLGRRLWTQYDLPLMRVGITVLAALALALLGRVALMNASGASQSELLHVGAGAVWGLLCGGVVGVMLPGCCSGRDYMVAAAAVGSAGGSLLFQLKLRAKQDVRQLLQREFLLLVLLGLLYCCGVFSNSFIVNEHHLHVFLGVSAVVVVGAAALRQAPRATAGAVLPHIAAAACLRCASAAGSSFRSSDIASTFSWALSLPPLPVVCYLFSRHMSRAHTALMACCSSATALFWLLEAVGPEPVAWLGLGPTSKLLPRVVYALSGAGLAAVVVQPNTRTDQAASVLATALTAAGHLCSVVVLLLGPSSPPVVMFMLLAAPLLVASVDALPAGHVGNRLGSVLAWALFGRGFFFFTGHHNQFSRLQYDCAFVGFDEFHLGVGGILLFVNTFGTEVLATLAMPALAAGRECQGPGGFVGELDQLMCVFVTLQTVKTLVCAVNVLIQRGHLMLWAIFAPKFLFDAIMQMVSAAAVLMLWALVIRVAAVPGLRVKRK